jgi:alkylation response protein AidB-like acyl-CoA dehydrogenase
MDLTAEEITLRDIVRRVVDKEIRPRAVELDESEDFPWQQIQALSEIGLMGILTPDNYGGQGASHLLYSVVVEEIARGCAATALVYFTQTHAQLPLLLAGTEEQKRKFIPKLASGEWLGAFVVTEPENGSDVARLKTRANRIEDGYLLNGEKVFITTGDKADVLTVFARTGDAGPKGISAFVVMKDTPGFEVARVEKKMGVRGSSTAALSFNDCFVPDERRLGEENEAFDLLLKTFDFTRLSTAAQSVGIAQGAYDIALNYAMGRAQFGKRIFDFQAVQFRLAQMLAEVSAARAFLYQVARMIDSHRVMRFPLEASMIKLWCSEMAGRVTNEAVQTLGGYGYMREYSVERMMRDAKITQIYDGTNDIQKLVIARRMLEEYRS